MSRVFQIMAIKCDFTFNGITAAIKQIEAEIEYRTTIAADACRVFIHDALESGAAITSDTHALAKGLYVQTTGGSDYAQRAQEAKDAYLNNPSAWSDLVRIVISAQAYTPADFDRVRLHEEPLPNVPANTYIAAVASLMAYGYLWEMGHNNALTGKYEHRPWMQKAAEDWGVRFMANYYRNLV
jgi:hypothetical protein